MGHSVTLGGERVGSGNKNKVYLHNYERSTHNLSYDWLSTMGCGMLIPFMCELVTRDDKYEIDLDAGLRTIPTKGPLFGSFKMQLDVYKCPLRLYQALLHNNPLAIGLKANQVKFPKIRLYDVAEAKKKLSEAANNSLIKYLGISGLGTIESGNGEDVYRDFFGAHVLAYYDIFKNYYANKQEERAYTLYTQKRKIDEQYLDLQYINTFLYVETAEGTQNIISQIWYNSNTENNELRNPNPELTITSSYGAIDINIKRTTNETTGQDITKDDFLRKQITIYLIDENNNQQAQTKTIQQFIDAGIIENVYWWKIENGLPFNVKIRFNSTWQAPTTHKNYTYSKIIIGDKANAYEDAVELKTFDLKNIDDMRYEILSFHQMGQSYIIDGNEATGSKEPYYSAIGDNIDHYWKQTLSGICVKTYQSDIFNNWLNAELIDGENGIAEITAIATSSGSITIDQLQFSEKLYNLLNRIAVSGNTYQDYLDAAYTQSAKKFEESPIWVGGMSDEVVFEEIVQTAPATINGESTELGSLGGRGNLMGKRKGGKITVKIDEPALLIGIVSLTPRIVYTQGNMWFNTEIDSLQDIHVPALDAIGFQNLMAEQLHYGAQGINTNSELSERPIIGKVPAWINYMTSFDRAYGDFAATDGDGFMVLNRNYECKNGILQDATTYIDPAKFNYAFAYTKRDAQNFWVKISCNIKARRLMSAKQIPTA